MLCQQIVSPDYVEKAQPFWLSYLVIIFKQLDYFRSLKSVICLQTNIPMVWEIQRDIRLKKATQKNASQGYQYKRPASSVLLQYYKTDFLAAASWDHYHNVFNEWQINNTIKNVIRFKLQTDQQSQQNSCLQCLLINYWQSDINIWKEHQLSWQSHAVISWKINELRPFLSNPFHVKPLSCQTVLDYVYHIMVSIMCYHDP